MAYDPFTHRKKIPPFPSIYAPSDTKAATAQMPRIVPPGVKPVGSGWETPTSKDVGAIEDKYATPGIRLTGQLPPIPDLASPMQTAIPEIPTTAPIPPAPTSFGLQQDDTDDAGFAGGIMSEFDTLFKSVMAIGEPQGESDRAPGAYTPEGRYMGPPPKTAPMPNIMTDESGKELSPMSPITSRPSGSWNTPFNKTGTADWGTSLDERPQSNGPAASSVRYYERAMARAQGGSRPDANRINRLDRRINARPTNEY